METELVNQFRQLDTPGFPDFHTYKKPLEMGLWVLWVAKEKSSKKRLTAVEIASIIRDVEEISIDERAITNAFNRAKGKVHIYHEDGETFYEIMKPGKEHLLGLVKPQSMALIYFEPGKPYTSKSMLARKILDTLRGELRIVDPYCGDRTLDVLKDVKDRGVRFLTRLDNLREPGRTQFSRAVQDFRLETPNIEFRDYSKTDIHDRYIISSDYLVILGHSIKDLGAKESLAIILTKGTSQDIYDALTENFDARWNQSQQF